MWKIATNAYRKRRRWRTAAKRAGPEVALEEVVETAAEPAASQSSEESALERERARLLADAIRALPEQMRKCLMLRVYQDLKYREIGVVMGLSTETVKAHLFQARRKLQLGLGEHFNEPLQGIGEEP
jgi:RNA polymerase sigma-70 factor (ECF subfamily)